MSKLIELTIEDFEDGVFAISLVNKPAIQQPFFYFNEDGYKYEFAESYIDIEKRTITGPVMIPNKQIRRIDPETNELYFVYFSEDTIRKMAEKFLRNNYNNNTTKEHSKSIDGVYLSESWFVETEDDKINTKHKSNSPIGTWCMSYYIESDEIVEQIKKKELNGFSLEGRFAENIINKFSEVSQIKSDEEIILENIIKFLENN